MLESAVLNVLSKKHNSSNLTNTREEAKGDSKTVCRSLIMKAVKKAVMTNNKDGTSKAYQVLVIVLALILAVAVFVTMIYIRQGKKRKEQKACNGTQLKGKDVKTELKGKTSPVRGCS